MKRGQFTTTLQFGTQIWSYASSYENSCSKSSSGQGMRKLEKFSAWDLTKVRSRKEVIDEARTKGRYSSFCLSYRHLSSKECRTGDKAPKYKGWVAFRGDIVKDDSGSYAVFTAQGSSAAQMTAAKVMDIISRLPGCAGQAADAVSVCTKVKWKMLQNYWQFQKRNVQTFGFVWHDTNGLNHGPVWKIQSLGIYVVILQQDCHGKSNLRENPIEVRLGESF